MILHIAQTLRIRLRLAPSALAALLAVAGCTDRTSAGPVSGYTMRVASGDNQVAAAGSTLALPLVVVIENGAGAPAKGVRVRFTVTRGAGRGSYLEDAVSVTRPDGTAITRLVLGGDADTTRVRATLAAFDGVEAEFSAVGTAAAVVIASLSPADFKAGDTITIAGSGFGSSLPTVRVGGQAAVVLPDASASRVRAIAPPCLVPGATTVRVQTGGASSSDAAATYRATRAAVTLAPFETVTIPATQLSDCLSLAGSPGASYLLTAQFAAGTEAPVPVDWRLAAERSGGMLASIDAPRSDRARVRDRTAVQRAWEAKLRALERTISSQVIAEHRGGRPSAALREPPSVGSLRGFSVVASTDGSNFKPVTARLRYVGDHILVYTDTSTAIFTDTRLKDLARLMDRDLYAATVNAFGSEPDIDGDGRLTVLLSPVVNAMSKASECVQRGFVTGFFYGIDLLEREPNSNRAEIFYAFVPDSAGRWSCPHTEAEVIRTLQPTFMHELQHLISFNQHVLTRGGAIELPWLNEGLSHIAEEVGSKLFETRYPAPFGRGTTEQLFPDSAAPFIAPQMLNAYAYLYSTLEHSVTTYVGTGSLEERGASWLFMRWLGDQKGDAIFRRLVESPFTGIDNVERASGETFGALFGDFSIALFADSLPGLSRTAAPKRQRFMTRNVRQLMAREAVISGFTQPFPLRTYQLGAGGSLRSTMPAGTMMHAIVSDSGRGGSLRLSFTSQGLAPLAPWTGAQVGIMRLPP